MALPKIYSDDTAAREHLESLLWPEGPICPHCGNSDPTRIHKLAGKSTRPGVHKCRECEKPFSVTVGTVFERSHVPLHKWVYATHLLTSSKKGISSHQLMRMLDVTYKTAWFMSHRIREAMRPASMSPMGSGGKIVESDETFIGRKEGVRKAKAGFGHKNVVLTLVERGGSARSFHVDSVRWQDMAPIVNKNVAREAKLMTDEAPQYREIGRGFARHDAVNHSQDEYVRYEHDADGKPHVVHTNTVEGYYSVFKRGMKGIYQHCSEKHLHRYLSEFDFRYSHRVALGVDDAARADKAIEGAAGKRLTYRRPH